MFEFTIKEAEFLNQFKEKINMLINKSYKFTMSFLANPIVCEYRDNERLIFISINKSVYQNLYSFMHLNNNHMQYAAFACLETALYNMRVYYQLATNPDNLHKYITTSDFSLEEAEREQEEKEKNEKFDEKEEQFSVRAFCNSLHDFNVFSLKMPAISSQLIDRNIFLGLSCGKELSDELQNEIRKNMVGMYLSLSKHLKMFFNGGLDDEMDDLEEEVHKMFMQYLEKF